MIVTKDFRAPEDTLTGATCRRPDVQADWWTDVHTSRGHRQCHHALARHICRIHCPVLERCEAQLNEWGTDWDGMVIAGKLRVSVKRQSRPAKVQPRGAFICKICRGN